MDWIEPKSPAGVAELLESGSSLGPLEAWPPSLRATWRLMVQSKFPMFIAWGDSLSFLYNDAYVPILGAKHPGSFGRPFREVWAEIWPDIAPLVDRALAGEASWLEDLPLLMHRNGFDEPTWFTFSYSPALDDEGRIAGLFCACNETTEKVVAVRLNAAQSERLAQLFEQSPAFMALLDGPDHRFELANPAYLQLVGHREILGKPVREALPELEGQGFFELLDQVWADGEPFVGRQVPAAIERVPGGAKEQAWLDFVYQPVRDGDGGVTGIFVSGYEVTDLRQAQDQLQLAQRAGNVGAFELHPDTRSLTVTEEFCRIWGIAPSPTLQLYALLDLVAPEDRARLRSGDHDPSPDALGYTEYRIRRPDTGELHWIARRGEAIRDEDRGLLRFAGVVYDITDRKRVEEQLRRLTETLEERVAERTADRDRMWRLSTDVMLVGSFDGTIEAVNPAWKTLFGWSEEDLVGRSVLDLVHPEDRERTSAEMSNLERGLTTLRFENRYRRKDGSWRWLSWTAVPDEQHLHAVGRDIEAEKRAQEDLERTQEALRQAQKMEAVGQLTGGIAHDFNNLLTVVTGNLDMVRRLMDSQLDARSRRGLDNALRGAERAASLTQRLLAFSRRQPLQPRPLQLGRLITGMSDLLTRSLGETIQLESVTGAGLWEVEVDPNQLESALLNLAVNARDAMPGGGKLTIEVSNVELDAGYTRRESEVAPGQYAMIAVTDTGSGMRRDTLERVFEPFFTTKEVGRGTGLGLSMVYGFIKQSGGHVKIYSEEGQGTTVRLYLPRLQSGSFAEAEEELAEAPSAGRREESILVVEDDDDVRLYTVESLRELGYRVLEAHDGPSALRLLDRQDRVDLLFTDVVMPAMNGRELADLARQRLPGLRVLFTTGYARNAALHAGRLDPGVDLLPKPFTFAALAAKVRATLDRSASDRVLVIDSDPAFRTKALDLLQQIGFSGDEAANAAEALGKVRISEGRYDAILAGHLSRGGPPEALVQELRSIRSDLPVLLAVDDAEPLRDLYAGDPCVAIVPRALEPASLRSQLRLLGARCGG
ncbi:MAG: domain S-box protein [Alphaproteobacteria bacterium]|nr:domain S-box protein [Alphaproteobacteria bacterium]